MTLLKMIIEMTTCLKCVGFWLTFGYTRDIVLAGFIGIIGYVIDKYLFKSNLEI
jgi:uncharacterized membrane protein YjjB (DUF3815 family)